MQDEALVLGEEPSFDGEVDDQALGVTSMRRILADSTVFFEVSLDIWSVYGVNFPFDARRSFDQRWAGQTQIITFVRTEPDGGLYLLREGSRIKPPFFRSDPLRRGAGWWWHKSDA